MNIPLQNHQYHSAKEELYSSVCAGQIAGTEAAVHAVRSSFAPDDCEALLLVDASNAFNALNRQVALRNILHLCPCLATVLINSYRAESDLFVNGYVIKSSEGITQGDRLAMPMYAIATIPCTDPKAEKGCEAGVVCR